VATTPSKRTTTKKTAAKKKAAPKKAAATTKQAQAKALTAKKKVDDNVRGIEEARAAAADMEVTPASQWKGAVRREATKLLLPSGNVCLAFNEGMAAFLESDGDVPNPLIPIVIGAINDGKSVSGDEIKKMLEGDDAASFLTAMQEMTDSVTVRCVRQPTILPVPLAVREVEGEDGQVRVETYKLPMGETGVDARGKPVKRDPNGLYVDMLDLNDKMFVFNWVMGGSKDIERFRDEQAALMAAASAE
jgi:hypothetical protein